MAGIRITKKTAAKTTTGGKNFELLLIEPDGSFLHGGNEQAYFYLLDATKGGVTTHGRPGPAAVHLRRRSLFTCNTAQPSSRTTSTCTTTSATSSARASCSAKRRSPTKRAH